jgi:hypothetical protein
MTCSAAGKARGAVTPLPGGAPKADTFIGTVGLNAATAKVRLVQIAEEGISVLVRYPQAIVKIAVEISAEFLGGVGEQTKLGAVSENAASLGFRNGAWE